jgi:hypothetical protein
MKLSDGVCLIENDAHILAMMRAVKEESKLYLLVDHTNFLKHLREDVIIPILNQYLNIAGEDKENCSSSSIVDVEELEGSESGTDSEFYDSDYDAEDGDDDLFLDNVDKDVNDNNEHTQIVEEEDDTGLEHDDLNLSSEHHMQLKYKFKEFNSEVDMNCPVFKTGMVFSNMEEFRKSLNAYSVNERVKIRKTKNEAKRLHAQCEEGSPWMIKVSQDSRTEAFIVRNFVTHIHVRGFGN